MMIGLDFYSVVKHIHFHSLLSTSLFVVPAAV